MPSDTYTLTISDVGVSTPADGSVTTVKIADYNVAIAGTGVTTAKIVDGAITSAKIANGTIVAGDIENGAITTDKILNSNVTTDKIANVNVTTAKIADVNVTTAKIADDAITSAKIADNTIVDGNIALNTIALGKIAQIASKTILGNATTGTANVAASPCTTFGFQMLAAADAAGGRTALGLGTISTQPSDNVSITGGSITNVTFSGTSVNVSSPTGTLPAANGGTGYSNYTAGEMLYASGPTSLSKLSKGASTTYVLHGAGAGTAPSWGTINLATDVTGVLPIANGGSTTGANADTISFLTTGQTTDALAKGELRWNSTDETLDLKLAGDVTLQVGQESNIYVHNSESVDTIPNGSVVYVHGAADDNVAVRLATNANITSSKTLGVATQSITAGSHGYITTQGLVRGLDTSAFTSGDSLWLGVGGALTATEPVFPATAVRMAIVVRDDVEEGSIYVQPQLFSDGRVSGSFVWGAGGATSVSTTITGLSATSSVIIQERGATPVRSMYSVVCTTNSFIAHAAADASSGGGTVAGSLPASGTVFSYIAFI